MKKYIVLSVNSNVDYLYFTPLTCWAWRQFGWEPILMYHGDVNLLDWIEMPGKDIETIHVGSVFGYRSDTITQASRLYAGKFWEGDNSYLMTGDIDLIPLSDYWHPNLSKITVWGHDLTSYGHYPIAYIGMSADNWCDVMDLRGFTLNAAMSRDLNSNHNAHENAPWEKRWYHDQDLITERLNPYNPTIIERGKYANGYARGRVDRGAWTLSHSQYIDAHLFHQIFHKGREEYFEKTLELLHHIWPKEDFTWFIKYHLYYQKLTGHA